MAETAGIIFSTDTQLDPTFEERELPDVEGGEWYCKARKMRKDPTIALARAIVAAPLISNEWRVEGISKRAVRILEKVLLPLRERILEDAIFSAIDYGWQGWEVIPVRYGKKPLTYMEIKTLRHDITSILVDKNGFPAGLRNIPVQSYSVNYTDLPLSRIALIAGQSEYGNPYGRAILKNIEGISDKYDHVQKAATRYVDKVAGAFRLMWFPVGKSPVTGSTDPVENEIIAKTILKGLKSNGDAAFPVSSAELRNMIGNTGAGADSKKSAWDLKLLESSASGMDPFLEREKYYDSLKMRGMLSPERTALEGQHGTKEESGTHASIGLIAIEQWGQEIINWVNSPYGFVGRALEYNSFDYFPGCAKIVPLPLSDENRGFLREIFRTIVNNLADYSAVIDIEELGKRADIPILQEKLDSVLNKTGISKNGNSDKKEIKDADSKLDV